MKDIIYFDATRGVSGNMFAGSLINLGADFNKIKKDIESLDLDIELTYENKLTYGISAGLFAVIDKSTGKEADIGTNDEHHHNHRHLKDILDIINKSGLNENVKKASSDIFTLIAESEAQVHQCDINHIHFHEVGALDSIGDIVASCCAIYQFNAEKIYSSPVNTGSGYVKCQHGIMPVPAPASLKLLKNMPAFSDGTEEELATPTGIALLKYFASCYSDMPKMIIKESGSGMGTRDTGKPNIFRAILGELF